MGPTHETQVKSKQRPLMWFNLFSLFEMLSFIYIASKRHAGEDKKSWIIKCKDRGFWIRCKKMEQQSSPHHQHFENQGESIQQTVRFFFEKEQISCQEKIIPGIFF